MCEDAVVRRGGAPNVVFRLKPVDRHADLQTPDRRPFGRNRADRAGHAVGVDAALGELRQDGVLLTEAHQLLAADDRNLDGVLLVDDGEEAVDQFLSFVVGDLAERDVAAEVCVTVGVAAGTPERAFARDLDRQGGAVPAQDLPPRGDNPFHSAILAWWLLPLARDAAVHRGHLERVQPVRASRQRRAASIACAWPLGRNGGGRRSLTSVRTSSGLLVQLDTGESVMVQCRLTKPIRAGRLCPTPLCLCLNEIS